MITSLVDTLASFILTIMKPISKNKRNRLMNKFYKMALSNFLNEGEKSSSKGISVAIQLVNNKTELNRVLQKRAS